ncbi:MAG: hypothetical protein SH850_19375 [Planctomycetaceae bacterium]|nr:hypothetical protein [Planctomycetaceae bacterium]
MRVANIILSILAWHASLALSVQAQSDPIKWIEGHQPRAPRAAQYGNVVWVYWPSTLVEEAVLTAHELPELKPQWAYRPTDLTTKEIAVDGTTEWAPQRTVLKGISGYFQTGGVLICRGWLDESTLGYVALDATTGEERWMIEHAESSSQPQSVGDKRWLIFSDGHVRDLRDGKEVFQLSNQRDFARFANDALVFLVTNERYGPTHLRRVRLPSGEIDVDILLSDLLGDTWEEWSYTLRTVRGDLAILDMTRDGPADLSFRDRRQLVGIDLATRQIAWTTKLPRNALVELNASSEAGQDLQLEDDQDFQRRFGNNAEASPRARAAMTIDVATGVKALVRLPLPTEVLFWHLSSSDQHVSATFNRQRVWTFIVRPQRLLCFDGESGDVLWETDCPELPEEVQVIHDPSGTSEFLVTTSYETVHVFRRDSGAAVGFFGPEDAGATLRPLVRPNANATAATNAPHVISRADDFLIGPWPSRLMVALFALPLAWLTYRLWRQRPVS